MASATLQALDPLVGRWRFEVSDAEWLDPGGVLPGELEVTRLDEGLLSLRSVPEAPVPASLSVVGAGEGADAYTVLYADARGVSRVYAMTFDGRSWTQHRADPDFHQRFHAELDDDHRTMRGAWEASHDAGTTWQHDFSIRYDRLDRTQVGAASVGSRW